ncbi:MAG: GxxExxY protein [Patescibacteria group bacterium]|nr:GxxExxY protein [Patescibacteria group bacterium]
MYTDGFLYKDLTYKIIGCFYEVRNQYGPGQKEIIYKNALIEKLKKLNLKVETEKKIPIKSMDTNKTLGVYQPDIIVNNKVIIEIKSSKFTNKTDEKQLYFYLKNSIYQLGFLVNFSIPNIFMKRIIYTNQRKSAFITPNLHTSAFTLMELLLVVALIALLFISALIILNPLKQIQKAHDAKRKNEFNTLKKVLEDWYNDKNRYPLGSEICYDHPTSPRIDSYNLTACSCHICGSNSISPSFSPYLSRLPCDPASPKKDYLYEYDCSSEKPKWYRIYVNLDYSDYTNNDPGTVEVGCYSESCGPYPNYGYDYGVASNTDLEKSNSFAYCAESGCNACESGSYEECFNISIDFFCQRIRRIFPANYCSKQNCPCQPTD